MAKEPVPSRKGRKAINRLENYDYWNMKRDPHWMNGTGFWWDHSKGWQNENRTTRQYVFFRNMLRMKAIGREVK